jgi:RNA polymerase sigma-70 factor (ECF subfamily)
MSTTDETDNLVARAKYGDTDALTALYDLYAPHIFRYAFTIVRNSDTAEDVVSEAFLRAWTHLPTFRGTNFRAFLYKIARNYAFDVLRKDTHCEPLTGEPADSTKESDVMKQAITSEDARRVINALTQLPERYKEVVTLRFLEELSVKETAEVTGLSEIAVRVTQNRGLKKLEKLLS